MSKRVTTRVTVPLLAALLGLAPNVVGAANYYLLQRIKPTSEGEINLPADLNDTGFGTGTLLSSSITGSRALLFDAGLTTILGTLPTTGSERRSEGFGINNSNQIVGRSTHGNTDTNVRDHAFLYSPETGMQDLGTLGGLLSEAYGINDASQVVGRAQGGSGVFPVIWQNGTVLNLGNLDSSVQDGSANGINEQGHVTGHSKIDSSITRAFFWSDRNGNGRSDVGEMVNLGVAAGFDHSIGRAINDSDVVAGALVSINGTQTQAFSWRDINGNGISDSGEMVPLPFLPNGVSSNARAINRTSQIVGETFVRTPQRDVSTATLWQDGVAYDINQLVFGPERQRLSHAAAINTSGQILAGGDPRAAGGTRGVYFLTPLDGGPAPLVPSGANWSYLDDGSNQGTAWREPEFDDSSWQTGFAELGYGDFEEQRPEETTVDYGPTASNKFVTTYFRTAFNIPDPAFVSSLSLELLRDDGAAVFLNGMEIARDNLADNAAFNTLADRAIEGADETQFITIPVSVSRLRQGSNVLAVEIHQHQRNSPDISFDLRLIGVIVVPEPSGVVLGIAGLIGLVLIGRRRVSSS